MLKGMATLERNSADILMFGAKMFSGRLCSAAAITLLSMGMAPNATVHAASDTFNRPSRATSTEVEKIEDRRKALFGKMLDRPDDLDSAFEYAALSSQVGDLEGAIATLERMLIFAPGLPRLQLELGVLYFRLGAYKTAGTYFDAAVSGPNVPAEVRTKVQEYQNAIVRNTDSVVFSGAVSAGVRYQSNANNGPASTLVTLNGLDYVLSGSARKTPDVNGYLTGDYQAIVDLPAQGVKFKSTLRTYGEIYRERNDLNLGYAELTAGPSFDLNRFNLDGYTLDLYGIAGGGVLSNDPLTSTFGAGALLGARPTNDLFYGVRGEYRHETFYNSDSHPTLREKSGERVQGQLVTTYRLSSHVNLGLAGIVDRFNADVDSNSYWQFGGVAGLSVDFASPVGGLPGPWNFSISSQLSQRIHDRADTMIASDNQETTKWAVNLTQTIPIAKDWAALIQASYQRAWSNYDTSTFDNATVGFGLKKVF